MRAMIERCEADEPIDAVADALAADGAVIIEGLVDEGTRQTILRELDPYLNAADPTLAHLGEEARRFFGGSNRQVAGLTGKSPAFARSLLVNRTLLGCCDRILLPSCAHYQLNLAHLLAPGPGAEAQVLHRDDLLWRYVPRPHPELLVACIASLVDFTADLGATRVVPGSHRWERGRRAEEGEIVVAEMPAGSVVVYLGSTLHGAGANSTDHWRLGLHLSYVLGWLRSEDNNLLSTPPRLAADLPPEAQRLVGFARHDGLGSVEGLDPADFFTGELNKIPGPVPALDGPEWSRARDLVAASHVQATNDESEDLDDVHH